MLLPEFFHPTGSVHPVRLLDPQRFAHRIGVLGVCDSLAYCPSDTVLNVPLIAEAHKKSRQQRAIGTQSHFELTEPCVC